MCPQTQAVATAVIQAQTSDTKHLEDSPEPLGFKVSFTSRRIKQNALPQHLSEPSYTQHVIAKKDLPK